jgi:hypothetical protein
MSMLASFVQVEPGLLDRIRAEPSLAEGLFQPDLPAALDPGRMREAIVARGPQLLAGAMDMHPTLRAQIEEALGTSQAALRGGEGGDALFALIQERLGRGAPAKPAGAHDALSLDKAWHGVHYVLSGAVEPADSLEGQAVLGGDEVGEDLGYGPARCFTPAQVEAMAGVLAGPELEQEASERYDPERMTELSIYPFGWGPADREWVMEAFRNLRAFYAGAAARRFAVVTCLV